MKKLNFSFDNLEIKYNKAKSFLIKHYVSFFKEMPTLLFFIITVVINTVLLRVITVNNFFYIKPLFADIGVVFIIASFVFLFKTNKNRMRYLIIISLFLTIICVINSIYYSYYNSFASISLLATSTFMVDVGDAVVDQVLRPIDFIYLWQPLFVYYYYVKENKRKALKNRNETKIDRKFSFINMFVTGIVVLLFSFLLMNKVEWGRFGKMWNRESVVSSFGIYTYQFNDIFQSLEPKINNLFGHDKALKKVTDYYNQVDSIKKSNEYSNVYEGKNVIVIHAESLQTIALYKSFNGVEITPNLNKIASNGIYFDNYYSEVGVGTSSDAEFTFSSSMMPSSNGTVFVNYFDREYMTIQKAFSDKGYYTFSMHGNTGDFWNRATMHKNMGYSKFYSKSSYDIDEVVGLGLSDKSFFRQSVEKIKAIANEKEGPYYGTLITLSNHTPWSDLDLLDEYDTSWTVEINGESVVRDYLNGTTLGDYFRSLHYMDQAIGQFIEDMDREGLLDNTVIVIYGDHDARISKKNYNLMYNYDPYTDAVKVLGDDGYIEYNEYMYKLDKKVPFIIWTKDGKNKIKVSTATGMIDAFPIIANLFGVNRGTYALGRDVLGEKLVDNVVPFVDGSYVTNKVYYNGQNGEFYSVSDDAVTEEYIKSNASIANVMIDISNNIITYNLIEEIEKNKEDSN